MSYCDAFDSVGDVGAIIVIKNLFPDFSYNF